FVMVSQTNGNNYGDLHDSTAENFLSTSVTTAVTAKGLDQPFFVVMHPHVANTVNGSYAVNGDQWASTDMGSRIPWKQAIVFSGHSHYPIASERAIHQGTFTSVNTGAVAYVDMASGFAEYRGDRYDTPDDQENVGYYVEVWSDGTTHLTRLDFQAGTEMVGEPEWVVQAPRSSNWLQYTSTWDTQPPTWEAGSAITVDPIWGNDARVTFPQAVDNTEVDRYRIDFYDSTAPTVVAQRRIIYSHFYAGQDMPEELYWMASETRSDSRTDIGKWLTPGHTYTVKITAIDSFDRESAPLQATFTTPAASGKDALMIDAAFTASGLVDRTGRHQAFLTRSDSWPIDLPASGYPSVTWNDDVQRYAANNVNSSAKAWRIPLEYTEQTLIETAFTAESYFYSDGVQDASYENLWGSQDAGGHGVDISNYNSTQLKAEVYMPTTGGTSPAVQTVYIPKGEWVHLAVTFNGSQQKIYVNGVLQKTTTASGKLKWPTTSCSNQWYFGADCGALGSFLTKPDFTFTGSYSNARLYGRALSDAEILAEYQALSADRSALGEAVAQAQGLDDADYTAATWAGLAGPLADAQAVLENPDSTQAEIDTAAGALNDALAALVARADTTALQALVAQAEAVDTTGLTPGSVTALEEALAAAQAVLTSTAEPTQAQVDTAAGALQAALDGLVVDKSALQALVDANQAVYDSATAAEDYTAASYAGFKAAFEAAQTELAAANSTVDSVADAKAALQAAIDGLAEMGQVVAGTVRITGTPEVGATVTADAGTWTPAGVALSYQWSLNGVPVAGATGTTYVPKAADAGKTLTVTVTGTAPDHHPATETSPGVKVTETKPPAPRYERFALSPDLTGNKRGDILAIQASNGALHLISTTTTGGVASTKTVVASGLSGHRVFGPGDWNGDGKADVITVDPAGTMWLRAGNGAGSLAAPVQNGRGWANYRIVPAGDLNGDGANDMLAIDKDGLLWLYAGNGKGGFLPGRTEVG
ncbi:MAG: FIVAR domain-containing protein, partial [Bifidobacteriaceae bacterium]|nr:FIVAR domain-containing protein [Bifidobacteriaceae bacterium]